MATRIGIIGRDAHQAMHAAFRFQFAIGVVALDLQRAGFDPRFFAVVLVQHFHLVFVLVGPADIHAHQHGSPVLAFGAASPCIDLQITVVGIGFAREQRVELHFRHFSFQPGDGLLSFGNNRCITLLLAHGDEFAVVNHGLIDALNSGDAGLKILPTAHQLLRFLRIIPELGAFGFGVQLGQFAQRIVPVKDASSAARGTA